ncbi:MAG TPA: hypothetical protein ACFYDZ_02575 [Candidatus Brocadiaceae bacterium]
MKLQTKYVFMFIAVILGSLIHETIFARDVPLISFTLKDQFDREYTERSFSDKILVIIAADREGSKFSDSWRQAIYDAFVKRRGGEQVLFVNVADLSGAPSFLHGFIKGKLQKDKDHWSLMDWNGIFANAYGCEPKSCNILIFDSQQRLIYKTHVQKPDPQKLEEILSNVKF